MTDELERPIETDRLLLRPIRPDDADDLFEIMRDPAIGEPMGEEPVGSEAEMRTRIESWLRGPGSETSERWLNWLAWTRDQQLVAHLSATIQGPLAWIAWIVAVQHQRRGFATEASRAVMAHLSSRGIEEFAATIREGHLASEGVARRLGMNVTDEVVEDERVWRTSASTRQ